MQQLTKEQAIVLTGFTGILCCNRFIDFHEDVEKRIGYPIFTHQFADPDFKKTITELYRKDFMGMMPLG